MFDTKIIHRERVANTLTAHDCSVLYDKPRRYTETEYKCISTFPQDYRYKSKNQLIFLTGMSVPPIMTAQIANEIYVQWLSKLDRHG